MTKIPEVKPPAVAVGTTVYRPGRLFLAVSRNTALRVANALNNAKPSPESSGRFHYTGRQVFRDEVHIGNAITLRLADEVTKALNHYQPADRRGR